MSIAAPHGTPAGTPTPAPAIPSRKLSERKRKPTCAQLTHFHCIKHLLTQLAPAANANKPNGAGASKRARIHGPEDVASESSQHSSVQPDDPSSPPKQLNPTLVKLARSAVVAYLTETEKETGDGKTAWVKQQDIIDHLVDNPTDLAYRNYFKELTPQEAKEYLDHVFTSEEARSPSEQKLQRGAPEGEGPLDKSARFWSVIKGATTSEKAVKSLLQRTEGPVPDRRLDQHHGAEETELSLRGATDDATMRSTLLDKLHLDVKKKHANLDEAQKASHERLEERMKHMQQKMIEMADQEAADIERLEKELTEAQSKYFAESSNFGAYQVGSLRRFGQY
ncbi:hypothetical protein LTR56_020758 [Elasticomyces elasticus]|nr:hypothetical protein LTR22_024201 [Elasticomyces elasticus]KAK3624861.1 hypothetical protein LTR56_020758 [Elasticomyces elasticus]KAK4909859.1 hypothetical protein LTR49_021399 [Elasticomyces elasticus]